MSPAITEEVRRLNDAGRSTVMRSRAALRLLEAFLGVLAAVTAVALLDAQSPQIYRQAGAPVDARVADLLARMTLEEKVAQLLGASFRMRRAASIRPTRKRSSETGLARCRARAKSPGRPAVLPTGRPASTRCS
jgi:hypothetical protein